MIKNDINRAKENSTAILNLKHRQYYVCSLDCACSVCLSVTLSLSLSLSHFHVYPQIFITHFFVNSNNKLMGRFLKLYKKCTKTSTIRLLNNSKNLFGNRINCLSLHTILTHASFVCMYRVMSILFRMHLPFGLWNDNVFNKQWVWIFQNKKWF